MQNESLPDQLRKSSMAMVAYAVGSVVGGPIMGYVNDKLGGDRSLSRANLTLQILTYSVMIIQVEINSFGFFSYYAGFMLGASDSACLTHSSVMIATHWSHCSAELFAIFIIVKMIFMSFIMMIAQSVITISDFRVFFIGALIFNIFG
jgi:MFS family permease